MIDRRTKNAEIFRDTEQRYTTDQVLREAVETSIKMQAFISEDSIIRILSCLVSRKFQRLRANVSH